ncbi:MAG: TIGR00725 family protein [Candidatus Micrarchaeota archaeon]
MMLQIGVIGSRATKNRKALALARDVGKEIARRGAVLVCGGLEGVMEAACEGAKSERGITVGILPGSDVRAANKFVDIKIATGMGWARNQAVALSSDGIIMIEGECGTLSELCLAWAEGKPVVALATSGGYAEKFAGARVDEKREDKIHEAKNAREAIDKLSKLLKKKRR